MLFEYKFKDVALNNHLGAGGSDRTKQSRFFRSKLCGSFGIYADEFAATAFVLEFDDAFDEREQRVVFAAADVVAGFPLGAALARDDVAAEHMLAAEFLKTQPLCVRVASVSG